MRQKSGPHVTAEAHVKEIRRATRRRHNAEEKIRIVLEGLRGEYSIAQGARAMPVRLQIMILLATRIQIDCWHHFTIKAYHCGPRTSS